MYMLHNRNEQKLIQIEWIDGTKNSVDLRSNKPQDTYKSSLQWQWQVLIKNFNYHAIFKWVRVLQTKEEGLKTPQNVMEFEYNYV